MSVVVCVYSRYSKASSSLLSIMEGNLDFRRLCIDHPEFRRIVLQDSQKFNIRQVPCILVFFSNGVMNKYEGDKAFSWAQETITKIKSMMNHPEKIETVHVKERVYPSSNPIPSTPFTSLPTMESVPVEPVGTPLPPAPDSSVSTIDMRRRLDSAPLLKKTETQDAKRPEEREEPTIQDTNGQNLRAIKSDKQENLLTLAQQMQKERDQEEDGLNRRPSDILVS